MTVSDTPSNESEGAEPFRTPLGPQHPWPALESFQERDASFFFGREREADELQRLVHRQRLTLLYGVSGSGKTSLLQAGLFPRVRRDSLFPVHLRLDQGADAPTLTEQVSSELLRQARLHQVELPPLEGDCLWEIFHRAGFEMWSARNQLLFPLLVLDQFEELFTLGRKSPKDRRRSDAVLAELADLVEGRPPETLAEQLEEDPERIRAFTFGEHRYKVLFAFREDFLPEVDVLRDRIPSTIHNRFRLESMTGEAAVEAVVGPGAELVTHEVAERIVRFVAGTGTREEESQETGSPEPLAALEVEPALLSLVCSELNQRRLDQGRKQITPELLDTGRKEILTHFYEDSLRGMASEVRVLVEEELLTFSEDRDSLAWDNAVSTAGITEASLRKLVDRRLLRIEETPRGRRIELIHDRLTGVVAESRNRRHRKEEERARRRTQRRTTAVTLLGVLVALLIFLSYRQLQEQRKRREQANVQKAQLLIESGRVGEGTVNLAQVLRRDPGNASVRARIFDLLLRRRWPISAPLVVKLERPAYYLIWSPRGDLLAAYSRDFVELRSSETGKVITELPHEAAVRSASFSPDGRLLVTTSLDGIRVWNPAGVGVLFHIPGLPTAARFSPDGRWLVAASNLGEARVWSPETGDLAGPPLIHDASGIRAAVTSLAFSPDGETLVTGDEEGWVYLWNVRTRQPASPPWPHDKNTKVVAVSFSPDGKRLLTASREGRARLWIAETGQPVGSPMDTGEPLLGATFSPDGRHVLTVTGSSLLEAGTARIWDAGTGQSVGQPLSLGYGIAEAHFSPDGQIVLTVSSDGTARLWDSSTGQPIGEPFKHGGAVLAGAFSPDGMRVATTTQNSYLWLWQLPGSSPTSLILHHGGKVRSVAFRPDGAQVASAGEDATAKLWDVETGSLIGPPLRHEKTVNTVAFDPNGDRVVTASWDQTAKLWDATTHQELRTLRHDEYLSTGQDVRSAGFHPDGQQVVTVAGSAAYLWRSDTGERIATLAHDEPVSSARFSPDGRFVVAASADGTAKVWDSQTGNPTDTPPLHHDGVVLWAELSPEGRKIATAATDNTARLWDARFGEPIGEPLRHASAVRRVHFHPDGQTVVTASADGTARLWNVTSGQPVGEPMRHTQGVGSAQFSPDGRRVVTTSSDGTARIWDATTGQPLSDPLQHEDRVSAAAFDPLSRRVVTASWDGTARIWDIPMGTESDSVPLADLAEAVVGLKVNEQGAVVPVGDAPGEIQRLHDEAASKAPAAGWNVWDFIRWFLSDPETRPWSSYIPLPGDEDGPPASTSDAAASEAFSDVSAPVPAPAASSEAAAPSDAAS